MYENEGTPFRRVHNLYVRMAKIFGLYLYNEKQHPLNLKIMNNKFFLFLLNTNGIVYVSRARYDERKVMS